MMDALWHYCHTFLMSLQSLSSVCTRIDENAGLNILNLSARRLLGQGAHCHESS